MSDPLTPPPPTNSDKPKPNPPLSAVKPSTSTTSQPTSSSSLSSPPLSPDTTSPPPPIPEVPPPSSSTPPSTSPPPPIGSSPPPLPSAKGPSTSLSPPPPPLSTPPTSSVANASPGSAPSVGLGSAGPIPPPPPADENDQGSTSTIRSSIFKRLIPIGGAVIGLIALVLLVTRVILPAIQGSKEPEAVTLTYWGLWEESPILKAIIADYQSQNPHVTVNYQQQSHKDYRERLQSALARGAGPDIFRFHNTWVPMLKNELAPLPATVFDATAFNATFYPVAQKDLKIGNNIIGVPLMIDGLALYYNQDIFKAGDKSPPSSWEELRQTAFDLTVRDQSGKIQTAGVALGTTGNVEHWPDILALMLLQNGADPANPVGATAEDALKFYTIFSVSDKVWDETLPNSVFAFATEKVAMIFAPSWQAHTIKEINPDLNFGIVPVPQLPGTQVTWASYWAEGVSQKSANQETAFDFLKFLSEKNTLVKLYTEASKTRLFGEPYSRKDLASSLEADEIVGPFVSQAQEAESFYMASRTFDNGINDKIIKYYEDAVNAVNQGEDPEDVLQTVAQGVSQVLSQYGVSSRP